MNISKWPETRNQLAFQIAHWKHNDQNTTLVCPQGMYGRCFELPDASLGRFEDWFRKGSKSTWSLIITLSLGLGFGRVFARNMLEYSTYSLLVIGVLLSLLLVEYLCYRRRVWQFLKAFPEAEPSKMRIPRRWTEMSRIAAVSPVCKPWFICLWIGLGVLIGWISLQTYFSGGTSTPTFVLAGGFLSLIFIGLPLWAAKVHADFRREFGTPLTEGALTTVWTQR